jgi:short-subunit dehydrogenase
MSHRSALVTGASSGIGAAFAAALPTATGLLLTGRDAAALGAVAGGLDDGRTVQTLAADLATDAGRDAVIAAAEAAAIDLLICNAGIARFGRVIDHPPEVERAIVETNVVAPTVLVRALLPGMLDRARQARRRAGVIVVASTAAFQPLAFLATYTASKAFEMLYGEALAAEMTDEPIDVLTLCPGPTATRFQTRSEVPSAAFRDADDPGRVAREALAVLGRRPLHIVGRGNRMRAFGPRVLPRGTVAGLAAGVMRRMARGVG